MTLDIAPARSLSERRIDCLDRADHAARRGRVTEARRWLALARDYERFEADCREADEVHTFHTSAHSPVEPAEEPERAPPEPGQVHSFHTFHTPPRPRPEIAALQALVAGLEGPRADDLRRRVQRLAAPPIGPPKC